MGGRRKARARGKLFCIFFLPDIRGKQRTSSRRYSGRDKPTPLLLSLEREEECFSGKGGNFRVAFQKSLFFCLPSFLRECTYNASPPSYPRKHFPFFLLFSVRRGGETTRRMEQKGSNKKERRGGITTRIGFHLTNGSKSNGLIN